MKHAELGTNTQTASTFFERNESAKIFGEICVRYLELAKESGELKTQKLHLRISALFGPDCPRAAWVFFRLCTGDLSEITASHSEHGSIISRSKQAEHKEHQKALEVIALHFPELADAIKDLEAIKQKVECPESP